ncbi:hypothetical protein Y1Q_0006233 [Alligator mississippiensis]|uniref:Uncharacterized protein n=1 Tax=Alligator mississippiensis TaxID=8496 RepID=A0A151NYA4_ALLMI|nr:hypothetical protein Y1Q_0006233 [Alligator mississippiensis]
MSQDSTERAKNSRFRTSSRKHSTGSQSQCLFNMFLSVNEAATAQGMPTTTERAQEGIYWLAILVLEKPVCQHGL